MNPWPVIHSVRRWATAATVVALVFFVVLVVLTMAFPREPESEGIDLAPGVALILASLGAGRYIAATGWREWIEVALTTLAVFFFLVWLSLNVLPYAFPTDYFPEASPPS
jgi:FtsH-binding integral membrane protein